MRLSLLLLCCFLVAGARAQEATSPTAEQRQILDTYRDSLAGLAERMHTDTSAEVRFTACKLMIRTLVTALQTPNSFQYAFAGVPGMVVRNSPDGSFRTLTWELYVTSEEYRHFGALQRNSKTLDLVPLVDRGDALRENPENVLMSNKNWLGYVIYDILPGGEYQGRPYNLVLGYDRYGRYRRQKVLDVIFPTGRDSIQFGAPIFRTYSDEGLLYADRKRIILNYGAEATVALKYEAATATTPPRVIYEHLVLSPGGEAGPINMPDGSYRAISPNDSGIWEERSRIFDHKYEKAPRETARPADDKSLFGQPRG